MERELTWIIDRGIFSQALLDWVAHSSNKHLITWEKGYRGDGWPDTMTAQASMIMERARNNSKDLRSYHFEWIERDWSKNEKIRQLIVRATNPSGNKIEVSILCDDKERDASSIIWAMFDRWLQENDFKYLGKHFGIDEITSYQSQSYRELKESLEDRTVKNAAYLAICKERAQEKKLLMDVIKITARNLFYQSLEPFRKLYDNFRGDPVWFRHLTEITGFIDACDQVKCHLIENADYPKSVHEVIEETLALFNQSAPEMPDGSGRKLELILAQKSAFELAI